MKTILASRLKCIVQLLIAISTLASANAQLHAGFAATSTAGCSPMVVSFKDTSTGNPTQWKWDLGNGTISFQKNPSVSYINPGTYNIKLVVTNSSSSDSVTKTGYITVYDNPVVNFSSTLTTGCYPLRTQFTDLSIAPGSSINQWQWDFGDGFVSTQQHPSHVYTSQGSFTVKLKATNSNGCFKVIDKPAFINTNGGVKAGFTYVSSGNCQPPTPVNFTNTSTGTGILTYQWFFGDGGTSLQTNPVHSYNNAGSYTFKLIATNSAGCTDTIVKTNGINVGSVHADFTVDASACAGTAVSITNTSTPATASSVWYFSDGTNSTQINPTKTFANAGTYTIKLVNNFGSCKDSITRTITILAKPTAIFTAANNIACAAPVNVQFTNNSLGGVTYFWNFGDGNNSTLQNPTHPFSATGNYTVSLVVTNANGCKDSIKKTDFVTVHAPQIGGIEADTSQGCAPLTVHFTPSISSVQGIAQYVWSFGDGNTSNLQSPTHVYTSEGIFTVKLVITTTGGCTDTLVSIGAVRAGHKPHADFSATPLDGCATTGVSFTDLSTNGPITNWYWQFGDGKTSIGSDPFTQYQAEGYFTVMLIASNNGCADTMIKPNYVHVKPPIARFTQTASNCTNKLEVAFTDQSLGALTHLWDFGDGTTSTAINPVHVFPATGVYNVTLTVTNGDCSHVKPRQIYVDNRKGKLKISSMVTCRMDAVNFSLDSLDFGSVASYTWILGNATTVTTTDPTTAWRFAQVGTYPISVIVAYANGCNDTLTSSSFVTVYGPTASFTSSNSFVCSGTTVFFSDASTTDGQHNITNWSWNYGDGSSLVNYANGPFSHQYNVGGNMTVSLKITDSYGCTDSIAQTNILNVSKTVASFVESDTSICPGYHVDFNNTSTGNNLAFQWFFGDGNIAASQSPSHTYPNEGTYTIKLIAIDPNGCNDTLVKTSRIKVYKPVAHFTMSDTFAVCPPLLVSMTNTSTNAPINNWTFGNAASANIAQPSHLYTYPGNYTVTLVAANNGGCTDTARRTVKILGPTGTFTYSPNLACVPVQVNFSAVTQNAVKLIWDYNNGVTSTTTVNTSSYVYALSGSYIPKLILEDVDGCKVPIIGADTIKAKDIKAQIAAQNILVCDSANVTFNQSSITNDVITNYLWKFSDGSSSILAQPIKKFNTNGFHSVKLVVKTQTGCTDSTTVNNLVKVVSSPRLVVTNDTSVCLNSSLLFTSSIANPDTSSISWNWNFGNGNTSTLQNPPVQNFTSTGNITVTTIVNSSNGCADTSIKVVAVRGLPTVDAGVDTFICRNQSYTLKATGAATYTWSQHPTLSCLTCASPIAKPLTDVMYYVTGKNAFNCSATDSIRIQVQQPTKLTFSKNDTLCLGSTAKLNATGAEKYSWSPALYIDNPSAAQVNVRPAKDTLMNYRIIGADNRGCFADTGYIKVKTYPIPKMEIKQNDIIVNAGSSVKLETTNSADVTKWKWTPAKGLDKDNVAIPTALARESTVYTCVAANEGKCVTRDEVKITVICNNANVFVPNTFSPNGDGNNDIFYPRGKGVFTIKNLRIFNRWGEVVFERMNFQANDVSAGWDGAFKGAKLPSDAYVYAMEVQCDNGTIIPTKGNVTLLR